MPKYSMSAGKDVERAMHKFKRGKLKSSRGGKVKSRKQAIAIGLSEAREKGKKVPKKKNKFPFNLVKIRNIMPLECLVQIKKRAVGQEDS